MKINPGAIENLEVMKFQSKKRHVDFSHRVDLPFFSGRFRFVLLILTTLCLTSIFSNVLTFNFTVICMDRESVNWDNSSAALHNISAAQNKNVSNNNNVGYSSYEKTVLQWTVSLAALITTFPFSWLLTQVE